MSPPQRRAAMKHLMRKYRVSERKASAVVGQYRPTRRYRPVPSDFEQRLAVVVRRLAEAHPRCGYRRVHVLLVGDGRSVNVKRVERAWRAEGLRVLPGMGVSVCLATWDRISGGVEPIAVGQQQDVECFFPVSDVPAGVGPAGLRAAFACDADPIEELQS